MDGTLGGWGVYHLQDSVGVVGEGLVLVVGVSGVDVEEGTLGGKRTMTHTPDRSLRVFAGGAAMVLARFGIEGEYFLAR